MRSVKIREFLLRRELFANGEKQLFVRLFALAMIDGLVTTKATASLLYSRNQRLQLRQQTLLSHLR